MNESQSELSKEVLILREEFSKRSKAGLQPRIEDYLNKCNSADRTVLLRELIVLECEFCREKGMGLERQKYLDRFPLDSEILNAAFQALGETSTHSDDSTLNSQSVDDSNVSPSIETLPPNDPSDTLSTPFSRYEIRRELGRGGFAVVYMAFDTELARNVAIKIPRAKNFTGERALQTFVREARNAARLDHEGIVRVHDVQRDQNSVVIVQQFIDGNNLSEYARKRSLSTRAVVELLVRVCRAVAYAHQQRVWHRDLKPANILIDADAKPHVADFGLALTEDSQHEQAGEIAGTPAYMSPEQVRGESHRLDGRSDIWSIGVILYELLTNQRPFNGDTNSQLFDEIQHREAKSPRMANPLIPQELCRICTKCLAKQSSDRYQSATDLIDDLESWMATNSDPNDNGIKRREIHWSSWAIVASVTILFCVGLLILRNSDRNRIPVVLKADKDSPGQFDLQIDVSETPFSVIDDDRKISFYVTRDAVQSGSLSTLVSSVIRDQISLDQVSGVTLSGGSFTINDRDLRQLNRLAGVTIANGEIFWDVSSVRQLTWLEIDGCNNLRKLDLSGCEMLTYLTVTDCPKLRELSGLENMPLLRYIHLNYLPDLVILSGINEARGLRDISISNADRIETNHQIDFRNFVDLKRLVLGGIDRQNLSELARCTLLEWLAIEDAPSLMDIGSLRSMPSLRKFCFTNCPKVNDVSPLRNLPRLDVFSDFEAMNKLQQDTTVSIQSQKAFWKQFDENTRQGVADAK